MLLGLELSEAEFRQAQDLMLEHFGIEPSASRRGFIQLKLGHRVWVLGFGSFAEYFRYLRFVDPQGRELNRMMALVSDGDTFFLREPHQLAVFQQDILPALCQRKVAASDRSVLLYSVGCSTGEEAYSLAMHVLESRLFDKQWRVRVVGADMNETALQIAQRGVYYEASFRGSPSPPLAARYFYPLGGGACEVGERLRQITTFVAANVASPTIGATLAGADVIFCRNVFKYLAPECRRRAACAFYRALNPGGCLLLSTSESLEDACDDFQALRTPGTVVYVKPATR